MSSRERYRVALDAAVREYEELGAKRREIDERLAQLAQTIGTLNRLCGFVPTVEWGLTDACRLVLKGARGAMTPSEVRDRLQVIGFDVAKYANSLAAIHTVLKRLDGAGEVEVLRRAGGRSRYAWRPAADPGPPWLPGLAAGIGSAPARPPSRRKRR